MIVRAFILLALCGMTVLLCQFSPQTKGGDEAGVLAELPMVAGSFVGNSEEPSEQERTHCSARGESRHGWTGSWGGTGTACLTSAPGCDSMSAFHASTQSRGRALAAHLAMLGNVALPPVRRHCAGDLRPCAALAPPGREASN